MPAFDEQWSQVAAKELSSVVGDDVDLVIETTILGGSAGDVTTTWQVTNGTVSVGASAAAAVGFNCSAKDALAILDGSLPPAVAFMQGRLKTTGDNGLVLQMMEAASTTAFDELRRQLPSS